MLFFVVAVYFLTSRRYLGLEFVGVLGIVIIRIIWGWKYQGCLGLGFSRLDRRSDGRLDGRAGGWSVGPEQFLVKLIDFSRDALIYIYIYRERETER